jgi:hypothetical protein
MNKKLDLANNQIKIELNTDNNIIKQSLHNMEQVNKEEIIDVKNDLMIQKKGLKRNTIDKYYTKINIVEQCIEAMKKYINISKDYLIIEPSAGNGSFIEHIKKITENYKFYDIEPENKEIIKQDFLNFDFIELKQKYKNIHIVGNPPFGR